MSSTTVFSARRAVSSAEGSSFWWSRVYGLGKPVTGAYWVKVKVGGVERPVLFQVFERRVLTYNPANEAAFRTHASRLTPSWPRPG
jgi:hypothetical protein